ncbi:RNA-binding domain-containing protein [uncultured Methanomethylovorans sp.]|uniref:RNA-binding domain-containing protein n=1 Tax=uncultured Methanomethylovorans sp. TaxID=183759 RepID=UPI002AA6C4B7|nr:RNA-binding domain-containing protein [uncultured Methanomethylovorans sp.]
MIEVRVSARVNPTETEEKVRTAVQSIFPLTDITYNAANDTVLHGMVEGTTNLEGLRHLHLLLREEEIIDTARTQLEVGIREDEPSTSFRISKFVAFVGRLNFPADEEPLGSIHVTMSASSSFELHRLIEWLTPPTEKGKILFESDIEDVESA